MNAFSQEDPVPGICIILKDLDANFFGIQQAGDTSVMGLQGEMGRDDKKKDLIKTERRTVAVLCHCHYKKVLARVSQKTF